MQNRYNYLGESKVILNQPDYPRNFKSNQSRPLTASLFNDIKKIKEFEENNLSDSLKNDLETIEEMKIKEYPFLSEGLAIIIDQDSYNNHGEAALKARYFFFSFFFLFFFLIIRKIDIIIPVNQK